MRPSPEPPDSAADLLDNGVEGFFADVGQVGSLDPAPKPLDGIELRRIGGKPDDLEPRCPLDEFPHRLCTVSLQAVPDEHDPSPKVAEEMPEEDQDLRSAHLASVKAEEHATASIAAVRQRSDRRHALPTPHLRAKHGRLATRGPRATDDGSFREAAFV